MLLDATKYTTIYEKHNECVDDPWGESDPDSTQTSHCLNDPPKAHLILEKERGRN